MAKGDSLERGIFAIFVTLIHHSYSLPTLEPNKGIHRAVVFLWMCTKDTEMVYSSKIKSLHFTKLTLSQSLLGSEKNMVVTSDIPG